MFKSIDKQGWILRLIYCLFFIQAGAWYSLFGLFLDRFGLNGLESGIIIGIFPVMMLLAMPFWGMVADKLGHKKALLITALLTSLSYGLYFFGKSFWYFFASTIIVALVYNPTMNSLLDSIALDYVDKHKKTNFGNFRVWGSFGYAAGSLFAGKIMSLVAMKYIFIVASILLFVGWCLLFFVRTETIVKKENNDSIYKGLIPVLRNKVILRFLFLNTIIAISIQSVWSFYSVYLSKIGADDQTVGIGIMLQALVELPFFPIAYIVIKKFGLIRAITISTFFTAVRLFLYSSVSNPYLALPIESLQGFSYILNLLAAIEFLNLTVPVQWRATGQSLFASTYFGVGAIVGNWWAGYLIDRFDIQKMFLVNSGIMVFVFLFSFLIKNKKYEPVEIQNNQ